MSDIEKSLIFCQNHLNTTNGKGTEIESYLTQFLLVSICGRYEKEIERIVNQRAEKSGDVELASFVKETMEAYKHLKLDAVRGKILKKFSEKYADLFDAKIMGKDSQIYYQNIVINRDASAHGGIVNMTFDDLVKAHGHAKEVLEALHDALNS